MNMSQSRRHMFLLGAIALLLAAAAVSTAQEAPLAPTPAMVAYLDRSYYTSELRAVVVVELSPAAQELGPGKITLRNEQGLVLGEPPGAARSELPFDIAA